MKKRLSIVMLLVCLSAAVCMTGCKGSSTGKEAAREATTETATDSTFQGLEEDDGVIDDMSDDEVVVEE